MENVSIATAQNVSIEYPLATLGDRILAELLDTLIKIAFVFVAGILFYAFMNDADSSSVSWIIFIVVAGGPFVFYHLLFEVFMNGQTPGKRTMKCAVASVDGDPVTFGKYMIRWLFRLIDIPLYGVVAMLAIGLSEKRQRVGDMLAHTIVVKTKAAVSVETSLFMPEEAGTEYVVNYPEVSSLTPQDIHLIKQVLVTSGKTGNQLLTLELSNKVAQMLNVQRKEGPETFLEIVLSDYKHLS